MLFNLIKRLALRVKAIFAPSISQLVKEWVNALDSRPQDFKLFALSDSGSFWAFPPGNSAFLCISPVGIDVAYLDDTRIVLEPGNIYLQEVGFGPCILLSEIETVILVNAIQRWNAVSYSFPIAAISGEKANAA
jgi:hypothetical protein